MKKYIFVKVGSKRLIVKKETISTQETKKLLVSIINQQKSKQHENN
jgi:hypothetical protein